MAAQITGLNPGLPKTRYDQDRGSRSDRKRAGDAANRSNRQGLAQKSLILRRRRRAIRPISMQAAKTHKIMEIVVVLILFFSY
jgi:hypothetical protein